MVNLAFDYERNDIKVLLQFRGPQFLEQFKAWAMTVLFMILGQKTWCAVRDDEISHQKGRIST